MGWPDRAVDPKKTLDRILHARPEPTPTLAPPAAVPAGDREDEAGTPDFSQPYRAFGHPMGRPLRSLFLYFNAAERRRYGKKKMQLQYEHLDSDDPASEGFAEDGRSFALVVVGARKALRITVRGRQLEQGYDWLTFHRLPWLRSFDQDRDFDQLEGPVITSIVIETVEEAEEAKQAELA